MYTYTWKKYIPVIRLLLKKAASSEQQVTLSRIDFERAGSTRKPSCFFTIELVKGRFSVDNPLAQPLAARELLQVMQEDEVIRLLLREHRYQVRFNSQYQ